MGDIVISMLYSIYIISLPLWARRLGGDLCKCNLHFWIPPQNVTYIWGRYFSKCNLPPPEACAKNILNVTWFWGRGHGINMLHIKHPLLNVIWFWGRGLRINMLHNKPSTLRYNIGNYMKLHDIHTILCGGTN
jgi:hypothetical protein